VAEESKEHQVELRAYVFIDQMQPQFAAYEGTVARGDLPVAGMAELFIEIAPGNQIFNVADVALKATQARPGSMVVEREFGLLELHAHSQEDIKAAGRAMLDALGLREASRTPPTVTSAQVITNVDTYQAQLINRFRRGALIVPGETLFILEVFPAAYITLACNEAEKAARVKIIDMAALGRFGRMYLAGSESDAQVAREASLAAMERVRAESGAGAEPGSGTRTGRTRR